MIFILTNVPTTCTGLCIRLLVKVTGAGGMAFAGAHIRTQLGSYDLLWFVTGVIAMVAAFLVFLDRYEAHDGMASGA